MSIITGCQCTAEELKAIEGIATIIAAEQVFGPQSFEHKCALISPRVFMQFIKFMNAPGQSLSFEQLNRTYAALAERVISIYSTTYDGAEIELIPPRFGLTSVFNNAGSSGHDSKITAFISSYKDHRGALLKQHLSEKIIYNPGPQYANNM